MIKHKRPSLFGQTQFKIGRSIAADCSIFCYDKTKIFAAIKDNHLSFHKIKPFTLKKERKADLKTEQIRFKVCFLF